MKGILFLLTMSLSVFWVSAQKIEDVKNQLVFNKYKEAKIEVDKGMNNPKFNSKPEAFMLKAVIYAGLAMDEANKGKPAGDQLAAEADMAFKKYIEMEPAMTLVSDPIYQNGPINLYSNFYTSGYNDYTAKKWESAYEKLNKAVEYSDLLISKKLFQTPLDTNVLILAGVTAENNNHKDEAVRYYSRLADNKVNGDGFESVYRYLVSYYFGKMDLASFEKYKALGKQLYPKSEYFDYDKVDFAVGLQEKLEDKIKAVEEILKTDPNNFKGNEILGEVIFEELNPKNDSIPLPANADYLEKEMVEAFKKAAAAKPDYEVPFIYIGDHFINKAVRANKEREDHAVDMKKRTKPGTMASKEDIAKRDALDKKYGDILEQAREPYEKTITLYGSRKNLVLRDKQQYKKAASYLADIAVFKKIMSKGKPADVAKYAAEEEKWNKLWDSIK